LSNKLAVIVQKSGLDKPKAQVLLDNFSDYFQIASEWEKKAKAIIVTDASQTAEMQMARAGRLFLREKRIHIERTRKQLKEQALREGKAIDGIANVLKALIVPIEEHLEKQEKFVEIRAAEEAEQARLEAERKAELERKAKEEAERKERERIRLENERLKKEAEARERKIQAERKKAEAARKAAEEKARIEREKIEAEKRAIEERARREKLEAENAARIEKGKQEKRLAEQRAAAEAEKQAIEERARKEKAEAERRAKLEKEKQEKLLAKQKAAAEAERKWREKLEAQKVTCPYCRKRFIPMERQGVSGAISR